jgi:hypothetical protein
VFRLTTETIIRSTVRKQCCSSSINVINIIIIQRNVSKQVIVIKHAVCRPNKSSLSLLSLSLTLTLIALNLISVTIVATSIKDAIKASVLLEEAGVVVIPSFRVTLE